MQVKPLEIVIILLTGSLLLVLAATAVRYVAGRAGCDAACLARYIED